jgi:Zn-finger nucleic acid-binding protein
MTDKPSRNEDEYFAKREAEILQARREAAAKAERDAERRSHHMRCPKCGGHLFTEAYHQIQVDRCPDCLGVWFDAGEAEQVIKESGSGVGSVLAALVRGVRGKERRQA